MERLVLVLLVVAGLLSCTHAHSWVHCADYKEENGQFYDKAKCKGFPREYARKFGDKNFGEDVGMNYKPTPNQACQSMLTPESYTTTYPAPVYAPGQRVCLAWPPKNHVSARCNNPFMPDFGTRIFRSNVNPTSDPSMAQFEQNLVVDFGANKEPGAGVGFQNCPDFCSNNDKALCTGCFNIPANLAIGKYIFMWEWDFNDANDKYTTCFDVTIENRTPEPLQSLTRIGPDAYLAAKQANGVATGTATGSSGAGTGGNSGNSGGSGGSGSGSGSGNPKPEPEVDYPPCPYGTLLCNCTRTTKSGCKKSGLVCTSGVCVELSAVKKAAPEKSYAGNVAAGIILTAFFIVALVVGAIFVARRYPHSYAGVVIHNLMESTPLTNTTRKDPLMTNSYVPDRP